MVQGICDISASYGGNSLRHFCRVAPIRTPPVRRVLEPLR
ncbi:hypothetical protein ATSB10_07500 [Dyella thiooxydans]|uniref:Uncharacterized protein n=1 Tax=Dyella thiooxydans TaxID=445710 RepID=A0A160MYN9_9GAMM|nr:hypothetical protein ATSB10_07500 [Dyella thiooxydans]